MSNYTVKIIKNNQTIITLAANQNIDYDNYLWWQLSKLVKVLKNGFTSKEDLVSKIEKNVEHFQPSKESDYSNLIIDLDNNEMDKPLVPLYRFEDVNQNNCCIDLLKEDNQYFAVYEDGSKYQMQNVNFDCVLLNKEKVTLDEFIKVADFIDSLVIEDETDYVLNNQLVMRFNCI